MKTAKFVAILLTTVILTATVCYSEGKSGQPNTDAAKVEISNSRWAGRMIKVTVDPKIIPSNESVRYLFNTSEVKGKATKEIFGLPPEDVYKSLSFSIPFDEVKYGGEYMFNFDVKLKPDVSVPPAAEEFADAAISSFRKLINNSYNTHRNKLRAQLESALSAQDQAKAELSKAIGLTSADDAVMKQLEQEVDLSMLTEETTLQEVFEGILPHSVTPPLSIIVLWNDLSEKVFIEEVDPIDINGQGLGNVVLKTALNRILESVSTGGFAELGYQVENGVITIATRDSLPPDPWAKLAQITEHQAPDGMNREQKQKILKQKQEMEVTIAGLNARTSAISSQISEVRSKIEAEIEGDQTIQELREIREIYLARKAKSKETGSEELQAAKELIKVRTELAKHRQEVAKAAGSEQLMKLNSELTQLTINHAEKKAMLEVVNKQLEQMGDNLREKPVFGPQLLEIRRAKEAYEVAEARANELKTQITNLQPPTVTVLGE